MKKTLRTCFFLLLALSLLTVSVFADSGPKPRLTVKVKNAPNELYYLDLLEEGTLNYEPESEYGELQYSYSKEELETLFDHDLLMALHAAVPEGWHACTVQGTIHAIPMWGEIEGRESGDVRLHSFGYVGVPEEYRIIVVQKSGEVWISPETCARKTLQSSVTVDLANGEVTVPSAVKAYAAQILCTLLTTLILEGALLFAFGYRSKKSIGVFLIVNLVTQGGLSAFVAVSTLRGGVNAWSFMGFLMAELAILFVELLLYHRLLTERGCNRAVWYAVCANICSAVAGLWVIEAVWSWIVSLL